MEMFVAMIAAVTLIWMVGISCIAGTLLFGAVVHVCETIVLTIRGL